MSKRPLGLLKRRGDHLLIVQQPKPVPSDRHYSTLGKKSNSDIKLLKNNKKSKSQQFNVKIN